MKFSIITPTYNRFDGRLQRCMDSVATQVLRDFEHIIVDDGSTDGTQEALGIYEHEPGVYKGGRLRYIRIEHQGRVIARNVGTEAAQGNWLCWIDSDDSWDPMYLATVDYYSKQNPDTNLFCVGAVVHGVKKDDRGVHLVPAWTKLRHAWMPPVDTNGCHSLFNSGKIGTGMFIYSREAYEAIGPMPPWANHNKIADGIDEWLGLPRGTTGYGTDNALYPRGLVGNPFGEDHAYFQKLCMHFRVELIPACLYIHYVR